MYSTVGDIYIYHMDLTIQIGLLAEWGWGVGE